MPKILLTVPETESCITRPIVLEVTRQVMELTGIDKKKTQIFYPGDLESIAQPGSTLGSEGAPNLLPFNERIAIEVEEEADEDFLAATAIHRPENRLIFLDDELGVVIRPVYGMANMTLNFRYRATDRVRAERWRDEIRLRMNTAGQPHLHSLSYHFVIPDKMLLVLEEIHRLREANEGYGESYPDYFNARSSQRLSVLANLIGREKVLAMSETQTRIPGVFDFTAEPEKGEKDSEGEAWTISFTYKFRYDKPLACHMTYPLVVHNQLIGDKFRDTAPKGEKPAVAYTASAAAFAFFEADRDQNPRRHSLGIGLPDFDEFIPTYILPNTRRVVTALTTIDPAKPELLMNFTDLDTHTLLPEIVTFLKAESAYIDKPYQSLFTISLYRDLDLMSAGKLKVTKDLDVLCTEELSQRHYYHVRLALVEDLRLVTKAALERARQHGAALVQILATLEPRLVEYDRLPPIRRNDYVTYADLDAAIDFMNRHVRDGTSLERRQFNTVQTLFVEAHPHADS